MKIVIPKEFDFALNAPKNWKPSRDGACAALPVRCILFDNQDNSYDVRQPGFQSFWRPTTEELELLKAGHCITLFVIGSSHPVVALGVEQVEEQIIPKEILGG